MLVRICCSNAIGNCSTTTPEYVVLDNMCCMSIQSQTHTFCEQKTLCVPPTSLAAVASRRRHARRVRSRESLGSAQCMRACTYVRLSYILHTAHDITSIDRLAHGGCDDEFILHIRTVCYRIGCQRTEDTCARRSMHSSLTPTESHVT
jgi:hypothetical protein